MATVITRHSLTLIIFTTLNFSPTEININLEFSLIMSLDILQNDWTRLDKDFSYKFQGENLNQDWSG